jgi:hypothetical protein
LMTLPRWHGSYYTIAHSVGIWDDARIVVFMLLVVTLLDITNFTWTMIHFLFSKHLPINVFASAASLILRTKLQQSRCDPISNGLIRVRNRGRGEE